jgi:hypothetical protein
VGARFWEEIGNQPTSAVIVDRAVRLCMPVTDLNETVREADQAVQASVVREIMSKVDQAVEASSYDEPVFATCAKIYKEWQATISKSARITLAGIYVDDLWFELQRSGRLPDYSDEVPRDKPDYEYRGIRPFFFLVRKRIDEIAAGESI